ncbi:MAG: peptidylprolyl isomerase [Bacteroidales bacterium]|nr:peptidylprolyl isomerase [Bacteroidales bacterium]
MKRKTLGFLLTAVAVLILNNSFAQNQEPLMTVADDAVSSEEFMTVYKKNNLENQVIDKKSMKEYLELYINFKLKVKEAEELGMDTVSAFQEELAGYRKQLAQPYLVDNDLNETLLKEAYDRMKSDIRASHILLRVAPDATPEDTLRIYNKAVEILEKAKNGENFADLAVKYSEDPSARDMENQGRIRPGNKGDLGYFSVFNMVYPFESQIYNTEVNQVSGPVRTQFGYHIVYVKEKHEALGRVKIAHIMALMPKNANHDDSLNSLKKINDVYAKLQAGEKFEDLAKKYSDDKNTAARGGELQWFGVNTILPQFVQAIRKIEKVGDVSIPVETLYGYHIIKVLEKEEIGSFEDNKEEIKKKITKSDRAGLSRKSLLKRIKRDYNFKIDPETRKAFYTVVDQTIFSSKWEAVKAEALTAEMATIGDKVYTQADFADYLVETQKRIRPVEIEGYVDGKYYEFADKICLDYENSKLEGKYPEFRLLMQEYRDGILLFELTDQKVWSMAIKDTLGLEAFHNAHKDNYVWDKRVDATVYKVSDAEYVDQVRDLAAQGLAFDSIQKLVNNDTLKVVRAQKGIFEKGDNLIVDEFKWKKGLSKKTKMIDDKNTFVVIHDVLKAQPKQLNEARGLITADYQNHLEKLWIDQLRAKYPVVVNEDVFKSIKK